ncbi:hypothetical protein [uncultured Parabacteroides sp.]|uniref:hypothetical protein n=1 Tax=uncultured Parabacteroides sp. TaxID=512312 RepID=UPI00261FFC4B|nr:hypothetical protein [uncultured Parabacteroides sp.]
MKLLTTMMLGVCMSFSLSACESNTLENEPETPVTPQHPDKDFSLKNILDRCKSEKSSFSL